MSEGNIFMYQHLAEVAKAFHSGLIEGLSGKTKPKPKPQRNNIDHHWKHKKKGGNK